MEDDIDKIIINNRFKISKILSQNKERKICLCKDSSLDGLELLIKLFPLSICKKNSLYPDYLSHIKRLKEPSNLFLCPIVEVGEDKGFFYIAMEYIKGISLKELLEEQKSGLEVAQAVSLMIEILKSFKEIHDCGVTHGNIDSSSLILKGSLLCVAGYSPLAPKGLVRKEIISGCSKSTSMYECNMLDIYSLASVFYEMIIGVPLETIIKKRNIDPWEPKDSQLFSSSLISGVPKKLRNVILKGLTPSSDNFKSIDEFLESLEESFPIIKNPMMGKSKEKIVNYTIDDFKNTFILLQSEGIKIANTVFVINNFIKRIKTFLVFGNKLKEGQARIWWRGKGRIITFFYEEAVDIVSFSTEGVVLDAISVRPWAFSRKFLKDSFILELPGGSIEKFGIFTGDVLRFE